MSHFAQDDPGLCLLFQNNPSKCSQNVLLWMLNYPVTLLIDISVIALFGEPLLQVCGAVLQDAVSGLNPGPHTVLFFLPVECQGPGTRGWKEVWHLSRLHSVTLLHHCFASHTQDLDSAGWRSYCSGDMDQLPLFAVEKEFTPVLSGLKK